MIVALRPFLRTARQCEVETSRPVPNLATFSLSNLEPLLNPFPATHPQNPPVTPFAATHTNSPSRKSFTCHTYRKQRVYLFESAAVLPPLSRSPTSRPNRPYRRGALPHYLLVSRFTNLIAFRSFYNGFQQALP